MLNLQLATDPYWACLAQRNLNEILVDHAFCEQKAASSGISLIVRYPNKEKLVETMTVLVAEEWDHFSRVLSEMKKRGIKLAHPQVDEYAVRLLKMERKGLGSEKQLLDRLLVCAIIEARSCERFKLLSEILEDEELKTFYRELMESEAGHYTTFTNLARDYFPADEVADRLKELMIIEAEVVKEVALSGNRVH